MFGKLIYFIGKSEESRSEQTNLQILKWALKLPEETTDDQALIANFGTK